MENYLNIIPIELLDIIISYLYLQDINMFEDNFDYLTNYEYQFSLKYNKIYILMKEVFRIDTSVRLYKNMWEIFYIDFDNIEYEAILETLINKDFGYYHLNTLVDITSSTFNILFSCLMLNIYPNSYYIKKYFTDSFKSDMHSYFIYSLMTGAFRDNLINKKELFHLYFKNGISNELITINDIKNNFLWDGDHPIISLIAIKSKNFNKQELNEFINSFEYIEASENNVVLEYINSIIRYLKHIVRHNSY